MPSGRTGAARAALAAAVVGAGLLGLAYAGGVQGAAGGPASAEQYGARVTVCHKAGRRYRTITIPLTALRAHRRHGDTTGPCATRLNGAVATRVALTTAANGRRVTRIRRGFYWVVVTDRSRRANFHLTGPRVNRATTQRFRGTARWRVRFLRGTYRYRADVGARGGGTFRVR